MKHFKKSITAFFFIFLLAHAFSQTTDVLVRDFIKGSITEKIDVITTANSDGIAHSDLWKMALDFVYENYSILHDDGDFVKLARSVIQTSSKNDTDALLPSLKNIFSISQNPAITLDLLTVFSAISVENTEVVLLVNEYAQNLLDQGDAVDKDMLYLTIEVLGNFADASSFSVLFEAYAYSQDDEISKIAFQALSNIQGGNENQIRHFIDNGTPSEKYYTLLLVLNNSNNSDFFRAEMSEKSLSSTIINIGDVSTVDEYTVALQMAAIGELQRISWTRSANLITEFYLVAKSQFEAGSLSDENFVEVIQAFTALSSGNAGGYLSQYLEEFNKLQEENKAYSETVVLSVIQSLGLLGNKIAFDALLYTTYLEYPETIILAARDALVTLKW